MKKVIIAILSILMFMAATLNSMAANFQPYIGVGVGASFIDTGVSQVSGSASLDER